MGRVFSKTLILMSKELQQNELIRMINQGFPFEITIHKKIKKPGILGYFQKKVAASETRLFLIKEPTLATLDRIALESLDIDTEKFKDEEHFTNYLKKTNRLHYKKMAKIIAIACYDESKHINETEDDLTELFFKCLRPSELNQIVQIMDVASNHTDFMNSTLLVTAAQAQTAKTEIVEERLQDSTPLTEDGD